MQKLKIDEKQAVLRAEAKRATKAGDLAGRDEYWAGYHRGRAKAYREAASLLGGKKLPVKRPEYYGNVK